MSSRAQSAPADGTAAGAARYQTGFEAAAADMRQRGRYLPTTSVCDKMPAAGAPSTDLRHYRQLVRDLGRDGGERAWEAQIDVSVRQSKASTRSKGSQRSIGHVMRGMDDYFYRGGHFDHRGGHTIDLAALKQSNCLVVRPARDSDGQIVVITPRHIIDWLFASYNCKIEYDNDSGFWLGRCKGGAPGYNAIVGTLFGARVRIDRVRLF